MANKLIESTIRFVENTSRINGNLRSGVIKEAQSFPDAHVVQGLSMYDKSKKDGAMESEAKGVIAHHAETKLGYSRDKSKEFADHVSNVNARQKYISGPRSSLDSENLHGAIGGGDKFPEDHLKSGAEVLNHNIANGHPHPDDAVTLHGMALGYPHKKAIDFADAVSSAHARQKYISGPRSSLDSENLHGALGGSGKIS